MGALLVAATVVVTVTTRSSAANERPFRDLDRAQIELDESRALVSTIEKEIVESLGQIDGLAQQRDFLSLSEQDRTNQLREARRDSRELAIAAYMEGGMIGTSMYLLDAETAADLSFRTHLLREHTEGARIASIAYSALIADSDSTIVELAQNIDIIDERIRGLNEDLLRARARVDDAEWVLSIAEIHDIADGEFVRTGRAEPTAEQWANLRFCESTETYNIASGNGFFGAYQFTVETWYTVGGTSSPDLAPPEEQDARARLLFSRRGDQPWPVCGRYLVSNASPR